MPDLLNIATTLILAGAIYGGIRADLKHMRTQLEETTRAIARAHRRIDDHIDHGRQNTGR